MLTTKGMVSMKKMVLALAGAMACIGVAYAAENEAITSAAQNVAKIPDLVKSLNGQKTSDFAADVVSAVAAMPGKPSQKVGKMVAASEAFLGSVPGEEMPSLLANLTANVPFAYLPAWVKGFKGAVDGFFKSLSDDQYNKLVNDVIAKINKLGDTSDADKTVITAFALKLLARDKNPEEQIEWLGTLAIPVAYADQVKAAMPGVFAGNYDSVLGPDTKVVESKDIYVVMPNGDADFMKETLGTTDTGTALDPVDMAEDRAGIERPEPIIVGTGTGTGTGKGKDTGTSKKKPPVAKGYVGQSI